ncbi:hypothetical protein [Streptomyces griseoloalbus]|uniref:Uncharacterized protein n=1 Tax=Streptomyces griseoloalbus TaxID=67303 RepID=A0A7W8FBB7_9ACTN|nr:hypothetical protein [Streptomyces albaduncus]MBB5130113.1 hypothetical protein [Streptomyces albaduncus]GGW79489.1 hypothetical protein GCM10010340_67350 [Streptomyces albaduncus]
MDDRLSRACVNLRVAPVKLLDALCSLSGRPAPPSGPHPARRVYGRVLHAATSLPMGALQPGDVSAATEVRVGLLNAHVPPLSDAVARCIQHTVDDLGPADLWTLARCTAMTRDDLAWGATASLARERLEQPDSLDDIAAQVIVDEIAERTPCRWGRHHSDTARAALYRTLADLADVLLEVSESSPTPLAWSTDDNVRRSSTVIGGVVHDVLVQNAENPPSSAQPVWHHPSPPAAHTAWQWRITNGPTGRASHGCGPFPSALAARHGAECAITALAAGKCRL